MKLSGIEFGDHKISMIVISSAMGHDGSGMFPLTLLPSYRRLTQVVMDSKTTVLTKSSTFEKRVGNFVAYNPLTWKYVQKIGAIGMLNAYGLTNNGVTTNASEISRMIRRGHKVIPSFYPEFVKGRDIAIKETIEAVSVYSWFMNERWHARNDFWALELNFSCPNSKEKIRANIADSLACVKAVRQYNPKICIITKISYVHPYEFAWELVIAGANIIHAINAIPFNIIFSRPSPLSQAGGGAISGGPALARALEYNKGLRQVTGALIIMGCGITSVDDVKRYMDIGADAVSICSIARLNAKEAEKIIRKYN